MTVFYILKSGKIMHEILSSHTIHTTIPLRTSFLYFCCINTSVLSYWAHIFFFSTGRHGNVRLCIMRKVNDYWHLATKTGTAGRRMNSDYAAASVYLYTTGILATYTRTTLKELSAFCTLLSSKASKLFGCDLWCYLLGVQRALCRE